MKPKEGKPPRDGSRPGWSGLRAPLAASATTSDPEQCGAVRDRAAPLAYACRVRRDAERLSFEIVAREGSARAGILRTAHGEVSTMSRMSRSIAAPVNLAAATLNPAFDSPEMIAADALVLPVSIAVPQMVMIGAECCRLMTGVKA